MKQFRPTYLFVFVGLLLIGCNRGCTTRSTMESESKTIKRNGEKFVITAKLLDLRTSRAKSRRNRLNRTVSHSYEVSFDLNCSFLEDRDYYSLSVSNPDQVDLKTFLKEMKLKFSKDKTHLGIGYGDKVVSVYHFYKGKLLNDQMLIGFVFNRDWNEFDVNAFPDVTTAMREKLAECGPIQNRDFYKDFLDNISPTDSLHQKLLSQLSSCYFAQGYYTDQRVTKLAKNKHWRKMAVEEMSQYWRNDDIVLRDEQFKVIVSAINDPELYRLNDSLLLANWGQSGFRSEGKTTELIARMNNKKSPLDSALREVVVSNARSELANFTQVRRRVVDLEPDECIRLLIGVGEMEPVRAFIDKSLSNVSKYPSWDLIDCYYKLLDLYPKDIQNRLLSEADHVLEEVKDYTRGHMVDVLNGVVSCRQLKDWMKQYPDDIREHDIDDGC